MTEPHIVDYNLLIKCVTILLIVAAVVLVIFKSKWKGLKLKTKYGNVELDKDNSQATTANINTPKTSTVKQLYGYEEESLYRELKRIMGKINITISEVLVKFIFENNLHLKTYNEMKRYTDEKIAWFIDEYNKELSKSEPLKQFTITQILGNDEPLVRNLIDRGYDRIYNNHKGAHENLLKILKDNKNNNFSQEILDKILEISRDTNLYDTNIIGDTFRGVNMRIKEAFKDNILKK